MTSTQTTEELYRQYKISLRKVADIKYANAVLQWDQETYLPPKGASFRGQQLATLSEVAHELVTDDKLGAILTGLNGRAELTPQQSKNVALSLEDYTKVKKFSSAFVREMSETVSTSYHAWIKARRENDFSVFEEPLTRLVDLKKQEAEIIGYDQHPYNALLNDYEKGATVSQLNKVFADIQGPLKELLNEVAQQPPVDDSFLYQHFPKQQQWAWGQHIAQVLGFDFEAGRQDISEHPFSINFNNQDVRITTRINENDFAGMTWSTIHEVGHALYEQGLPAAEYGLPIGEYASLGIHESQSRLWENCVGRGLPFWTYYFPRLQEFFPEQFKDVDVHRFVKAINKVQPSLIRTEADELTYHFHVMIRYELEKLLIAGELSVKDIPAYWNEQYAKLLGVSVPDDLHGCLQDVHWSHGSFGYFATYSLGSFYAAQFWKQAQIDIPGLEQKIAAEGDTKRLLDWLRAKVHPHGKFYNSQELCQAVTGQSLDSKIFVEYYRAKMNVGS
jgi:carboxypeptidase Taq